MQNSQNCIFLIQVFLFLGTCCIGLNVQTCIMVALIQKKSFYRVFC
jgi:hypothetical protein